MPVRSCIAYASRLSGPSASATETYVPGLIDRLRSIGLGRINRVKGLLSLYGYMAQILETQHGVHTKKLWPRSILLSGK